MSLSSIDAPFTRRPVAGGSITGILVTLAIHGVLVYFVYRSQMAEPPAAPVVRDLIVTKMVTLGKPREKFWLPRIVTPPPPPKAPVPEIKLAQNPDAAPAPPPPVKPPPKPEDKQINTDLRRALNRAKALSQAAKEEPPEGSLTGSELGTTSTAEEGDAYATAVRDAIHRNWNAPSGLLDDAQLAGLTADVRVPIAADGKVGAPSLTKSSGNDLFDNSCLEAVRNTERVPPVPAAARSLFRGGFTLDFRGKDLAR